MRTTINLKGKEFPVYETKRGYYDFENAGYSIADVAGTKMSAIMAFAYFSIRACARRENINFPYRSLDEFVDDDAIMLQDLAELFRDVLKKEDSKQTEPTGEAQPVNSTAS